MYLELPNVAELEPMIDASAVAQIIGLRPRTLTAEWLERNDFPRPVCVNSRVRRWRREDIERWLGKRQST